MKNHFAPQKRFYMFTVVILEATYGKRQNQISQQR